MNSINKRIKLSKEFKTYDKIFFGLSFIFAFLFMSHPDLWETANHSYVFLESVFSGNFMNFYELCAAHNNLYYYINVANYNIMIYILFGLWELPVFAFNKIFGFALNEIFIIYWAKIISVGFFIGSGIIVKKICDALGMENSKSYMAAMFFIFNPISFFSPMAMGQYDTLCLFFMLWALLYYLDGDMKKFSFVIGISVVFKFFSLLIFIPLILLNEKKILNIIKYSFLSLWLYIPTTFIFWGRTGNAAVFTNAMINRMFEITYDTGMRAVPAFVLVYSLIVFATFLYVPKNETLRKYLAIYIPMVIFSFLFNSIYWHPQWLILMVPFIVITTFMQKNKEPWFYIDIIMAIAFFSYCLYNYSNQTGAILFDGGLLYHLFDIRIATSQSWQPLSKFLENIPYISVMTPVMFTGSILGNIIFKFPILNESLADKMSDEKKYSKLNEKCFLYAIFIIGFIGTWLVPSMLEAINALGII